MYFSLTAPTGLRVAILMTLFSSAALHNARAQTAPPTLTCSGTTNAATATYAAADVGQVLNTRAVGGADRGNQPRWSWAEPVAYVGGQSVGSAPASVPAGLAYTAFTGNETVGYVGSAYPYIYNDRVGWRGKAGAVANTIRFIRYPFSLASDVDPATLQITLSGISADDVLAAVYINGQRWTSWVSTVGSPGQTTSHRRLRSSWTSRSERPSTGSIEQSR